MEGPVMQNDSSPDAKKESHLSLLVYTIVALGIALIIRFFVAAPFIVDGTSMLPNFQNFNYLIVDRISYEFEAPQRGDVVVLELPQETSRDLIKRIIGVPGDTVILSGPNPTVTIVNAAHPQGFTLSEPYIDPANYGGATNMTVTLGPDQYFVLGDNRDVSADSRLWGILPRQDIIGKVFLRLYPFNELGIFPGQSRYSESASSTPAQ